MAWHKTNPVSLRLASIPGDRAKQHRKFRTIQVCLKDLQSALR